MSQPAPRRARDDMDVTDESRPSDPRPIANRSTTVFLVPDADIEQEICRQYLANKYPGFDERRMTVKFNLYRLHEDSHVIVVKRRGKLIGNRWVMSPGTGTYIDAQGMIRNKPIDPNTLIDEVHEGEPISFGRFVERQRFDTDGIQNYLGFLDALAADAWPCKIHPPKDERETMVFLRTA